jgi:hypothetical protein
MLDREPLQLQVLGAFLLEKTVAVPADKPLPHSDSSPRAVAQQYRLVKERTENLYPG